jgi:undecaprenyl diphosphate synthase
VAIIMDGNGRWAERRGQPRAAGHAVGARAVRRVVEAARGIGVATLSLYAFSADNWRRSAIEVRTLMALFASFLDSERERCRTRGVRLTVLGRRDRLEPALVRAIEAAEQATAGGSAMDLRIAIDYSSRDAILRAVALVASHPHAGAKSREEFGELLSQAMHSRVGAPDVDLLIRTGGERRLSDFLLWESAYAELVFVDRPWPEFCASDLEDAIAEYQRRDRRFGAAPSVDVQTA